MSNDNRIIRSHHLSKKQKRLLDGAPILDPDTLDRAIIGVVETPQGHAAVYDYEKLVEAMRVGDPSSSEEDVVEWISYNTVRALPYMGPRAPWILEEAVDDPDDPEAAHEQTGWNGKSWWRHG